MVQRVSELVNRQHAAAMCMNGLEMICQRVGTLIQPLMSARCTLSSGSDVCGIDTIKVKPWQNDVSIHKSFLAPFSLSSRGEKKKSRLQVCEVMDVGSKS